MIKIYVDYLDNSFTEEELIEKFDYEEFDSIDLDKVYENYFSEFPEKEDYFINRYDLNSSSDNYENELYDILLEEGIIYDYAFKTWIEEDFTIFKKGENNE